MRVKSKATKQNQFVYLLNKILGIKRKVQISLYINKQQVLVRMWRKGNPSALLVGMQTGTATVESSMEIPQKTKNGTVF